MGKKSTHCKEGHPRLGDEIRTPSRVIRCRECESLSGRECSVCEEWKPRASFTDNAWYKTGGYFGCRDCKKAFNRQDHLKRRYDLTLEDYATLLKSQGGTCALCDRTSAKNPFNQEGELFVDHDHETGKVRGLLCNAHNTAIGILGDTPEHLQKALEYLLKAVED